MGENHHGGQCKSTKDLQPVVTVVGSFLRDPHPLPPGAKPSLISSPSDPLLNNRLCQGDGMLPPRLVYKKTVAVLDSPLCFSLSSSSVLDHLYWGSQLPCEQRCGETHEP